MTESVRRRVLLDTGPLVAILNRTDKEHKRCSQTLSMIQGPLLTTWAVVTEAAWTLRDNHELLDGLYAAANQGIFELLEITRAELADIRQLAIRYRSLSPQLADLTLVYLAQREGLDTVFTLDCRDFSAYRSKGKIGFRLLP